MGLLVEQYANQQFGITDAQKYQAPGVALENSTHTHQFKLNAGNGMTTVGGPDSHVHIITDGVIKGANNHTHKIEKLYNSREELANDLLETDPLRAYVSGVKTR